MRVLLVEDDPTAEGLIQKALKQASYATDWVTSGELALEALAGIQYDFVVLNLDLPATDCLQVITTLRRQQNAVPLIIITARQGVEDRVQSLDAGADDYLLKPVEVGELLARMRAIFRRKHCNSQILMGNGVITLNPATREASVVSGRAVKLSNREFSLLQVLLARPGAILSRREIEDRIYGWGEEVASNTVDFLICSLRKKLGIDVIKNVRGVGWMVENNMQS